MTDRGRQRIEIAILAIAFGAGGGWGAFQFKLSALESRMANIELRVQDIFCNGNGRTC